MYKILIDRSTIKKNHEYDDHNLKRYVPGPIQVFVNDRHATDKEYEKYFNHDWDYFRNNNLKLEIRCEPIDVSCLLPPKYLFDYIPTLIKCSFCEEEFYHNEFAHDNDFNVENICPCCGMGCCCDIEFEKLTDDLIKNKGV